MVIPTATTMAPNQVVLMLFMISNATTDSKCDQTMTSQPTTNWGTPPDTKHLSSSGTTSTTTTTETTQTTLAEDSILINTFLLMILVIALFAFLIFISICVFFN